jgi:hypothetical protein
MYITRLASKEIFSPSNNIYREVGPAKDFSAPLHFTFRCGGYLGVTGKCYGSDLNLKYDCIFWGLAPPLYSSPIYCSKLSLDAFS